MNFLYFYINTITLNIAMFTIISKTFYLLFSLFLLVIKCHWLAQPILHFLLKSSVFFHRNIKQTHQQLKYIQLYVRTIYVRITKQKTVYQVVKKMSSNGYRKVA